MHDPSFTAIVSWPSAPLTDRLVRQSLGYLSSPPTIVSSFDDFMPSAVQNLLQWSTYDAIDHDLTQSHTDTKVLSSSYTIRKALIRKHYLSYSIHHYATKHPETTIKNAFPQTWELELSFADELDEMWNDELWDLAKEIDKNNADKWWILKPGMADRGMGIRLFHSKEDLRRIFEEFEANDSEEDEAEISSKDTNVMTSQLRHFVVQEYLSNVLLFDPLEVPLSQVPPSTANDLRGHKFHLRVYCVASGALTVYMYDRILALFSAVPYSHPTPSSGETSDVMDDLAAHLTNTSLQTERGETGVRLLDELIGCHILSGQPQCSPLPQTKELKRSRMMGQMLDPETIRAARQQQAQQIEQHQESQLFAAEDVEDLKVQIADVLAETFKAALEMSVHFQPVPNAFELYGVDFLVTHANNVQGATNKKFQVQLLEVNSEPAIELTGPRLTWILEDLFRAIGETCVQPYFTEENELESGVTRDKMRKCLEVQVRGSGGW